MKRLIIVMLGSLMLAGCAGKGGTAMPPSTPASANYFEYNRDDKTYVFGSVASMQWFIKDGSITDPEVRYFKGDPVTFEAPDLATLNRLAADFEKQHK
jgi:hypothetical protein